MDAVPKTKSYLVFSLLMDLTGGTKDSGRLQHDLEQRGVLRQTAELTQSQISIAIIPGPITSWVF